MSTTISAKNCKYYLIRIGRGTKDSQGDFIDHIQYKYNLSVVKFPDEEKMAIMGPSFKFFVEEDAWELPVEKLSEAIESDIPKNILCGLWLSGQLGNDTGIALHDCLNEEFDNFFKTTDQEDISNYGDCYFSIGSVTRDLELEIDTVSGEAKLNGQVFKSIDELYGHFDEDDWWVTGFTI
jgi:hypothetical protein